MKASLQTVFKRDFVFLEVPSLSICITFGLGYRDLGSRPDGIGIASSNLDRCPGQGRDPAPVLVGIRLRIGTVSPKSRLRSASANLEAKVPLCGPAISAVFKNLVQNSKPFPDFGHLRLDLVQCGPMCWIGIVFSTPLGTGIMVQIAIEIGFAISNPWDFFHGRDCVSNLDRVGMVTPQSQPGFVVAIFSSRPNPNQYRGCNPGLDLGP